MQLPLIQRTSSTAAALLLLATALLSRATEEKLDIPPSLVANLSDESEPVPTLRQLVDNAAMYATYGRSSLIHPAFFFSFSILLQFFQSLTRT